MVHLLRSDSVWDGDRPSENRDRYQQDEAWDCGAPRMVMVQLRSGVGGRISWKMVFSFQESSSWKIVVLFSGLILVVQDEPSTLWFGQFIDNLVSGFEIGTGSLALG
ncbi:hypothetical protein NPIL_371151 [Nephila pilipes]|uniref:Uncharacterized protein n=1 Tax=Nephila pilipes TaxID=299642 RepID=A0A8X6U4Y3_NEPPI|nr:hypothetical protein NPIL_371151 [Nephila pilipes]